MKIYKNINSNNVTVSYGKPLGEIAYIVGNKNDNDWLTIYDVDFSTLEHKEIDKKSVVANEIEWDIINKEYCDYIEVCDRGLKIKMNHSASEWFDNKRTFPGLVLPLSKLFHSRFQELNDTNQYTMRVIAQVYGENETETFEQVSCGLEVSSSLPNNNSIAYFIRSSGGDGSLYRGAQRTVNNITEDDAVSYNDPNLSIISFELCSSYYVDISTYSLKNPFEVIEINNNFNPKQVSRIYWNKGRKNKISSYSALNFCFAPTTTNKNRKNIAYFKRFCVQIKSHQV